LDLIIPVNTGEKLPGVTVDGPEPAPQRLTEKERQVLRSSACHRLVNYRSQQQPETSTERLLRKATSS
jgi:hypothetical protein